MSGNVKSMVWFQFAKEYILHFNTKSLAWSSEEAQPVREELAADLGKDLSV